jgi:(p)ppGpp synthase/HD superfamily hydrolase
MIAMMVVPHWTPDLYIRALAFAARAHGDQKVPGTGFPYIAHVATVTQEVMAALTAEPGLDGDLAVQCALLHDVIEDTGNTYEQVEREFGRKVADGVLALTKDMTVEKPRRLADSLVRIKAQPREAWMVKLADRITNLQPPPPQWTFEKRQEYRAEAILILDALRDASPMLAQRLADKIGEYDQFAR